MSKKKEKTKAVSLFLKTQLNLFFLIKHVNQRINATSHGVALSFLHPKIYNISEGWMQTKTINFLGWYTLS